MTAHRRFFARSYAARRRLRALERLWTGLERPINRLSAVYGLLRPYNPLYHLGALIIFLLIYLVLSGVYLTVFYRPGIERAYDSVAALSAPWFGSLMRSSHRYASDALLLVCILHALKMLLSDRFWGSRWLAWVSGWGLVVILWITGTMGYFLVWDQPAQWLTEYGMNLLGGSFAVSFLAADAAVRTYSFFIIILFLHIFIPLLLPLGILIHVLRLTRTRYWAPRWLMVAGTAALILVSLLAPVRNALPADLNQVVQRVELDWWYMGFLPAISRLGNPLFWGLAGAGGLVLVGLAWLWKGRHLGPAVVIPQNCTGCALCARECPYEAIEMLPRDLVLNGAEVDASPYPSIAVVKPHLCTGCGICVGACPDKAIELQGLDSVVIRQDLMRTSSRARAAGHPPLIVFACDRHQALGTLPALEEAAATESFDLVALGAAHSASQGLPPRVNTGAWTDSQGRVHPVMTAILPCMGMLHPNWAAENISAGAAAAIMLTCPGGDCAYREGPHWVQDRLKRRRTLRQGNTHIVELAPGSRREFMALWTGLVGDAQGAPAAALEATTVTLPGRASTSTSTLTSFRHFAAGFALLLFVFLLAPLFNLPATQAAPADSRLTIVINHSTAVMASAATLPPEIAAKLPPGIEPAAVLGGERFPMGLRIAIDGAPALERMYRPGGWRREGAIAQVEGLWLSPGRHQVDIQVQEDGQTWVAAFSAAVETQPGAAILIAWDPTQGGFLLREWP